MTASSFFNLINLSLRFKSRIIFRANCFSWTFGLDTKKNDSAESVLLDAHNARKLQEAAKKHKLMQPSVRHFIQRVFNVDDKFLDQELPKYCAYVINYTVKQAIENNQTSAIICSEAYNKHSTRLPLYFVDYESLQIIDPKNPYMFGGLSETDDSAENTRFVLGTHLAAYYKEPFFSDTAFFYITSFGQMAIYDYLEDILRSLLKQNGYQITNYLKTDILGNPDNKKAALSFGHIKFNWNKAAE